MNLSSWKSMSAEFWQICSAGKLSEVKDYANPRDLDKAFCYACSSGKLDVVKWLVETYPTINVHVDREYPFRLACSSGFLDVAKWFIEKYPETDVHAENDWAVKVAKENRRKNVVEWFLTKFPESKKLIEINEWLDRQDDKLSYILRKVGVDTNLGKLMLNVGEGQFKTQMKTMLTPRSLKRFEDLEKPKKL